MQLQIWLHLPAPAKTQCRMNDPETHPEPVVFSTKNFQEGSFSPSSIHTLTIRIYQVEGPLALSSGSTGIRDSCQGQAVPSWLGQLRIRGDRERYGELVRLWRIHPIEGASEVQTQRRPHPLVAFIHGFVGHFRGGADAVSLLERRAIAPDLL